MQRVLAKPRARKWSLRVGLGLLLLVSLMAFDGVSGGEFLMWLIGGGFCIYAIAQPTVAAFKRFEDTYGNRWWSIAHDRFGPKSSHHFRRATTSAYV